MPEQQRGEHIRIRTEFGLRTDDEWVDRVTEHGTGGGTMMMPPIPLADDEIAELAARDERAGAAVGAFTAAALPTAAGAWVDQRAGGVVRLLLARPGTAERAVAEGIAARHGGVVELVEHSSRELDVVQAAVEREMRDRTPFGQAVTVVGTDVRANAVRLTLRGDLHPGLPEALAVAVASGTLLVEHPTAPFGGSDQSSPPAPVPADRVAAEPFPVWPGDREGDRRRHWYRCVQFVADRTVGARLEVAEGLAEQIGLVVRVIRPGSSRTDDLRSGRITIYVDADRVVREVRAE